MLPFVHIISYKCTISIFLWNLAGSAGLAYIAMPYLLDGSPIVTNVWHVTWKFVDPEDERERRVKETLSYDPTIALADYKPTIDLDTEHPSHTSTAS